MESVKSLDAVESVRRGVYLKDIPDMLLASQFFESVGTRTFSSEQRLVLAVLADVINVLRGHRVSIYRDERNPFNEALSWVFANGITSPLSFYHVCDALGLDAESLRRRLWDLASAHGGNLRKLRRTGMGWRLGPTITRVRRR